MKRVTRRGAVGVAKCRVLARLKEEILEAETGKYVVVISLTNKDEEAILAATEGLSHIDVGPLTFSPVGTLLAVGTGLGQVKSFKPQTGELVLMLDDEPAKLRRSRRRNSRRCSTTRRRCCRCGSNCA